MQSEVTATLHFMIKAAILSSIHETGPCQARFSVISLVEHDKLLNQTEPAGCDMELCDRVTCTAWSTTDQLTQTSGEDL